MSRNTIPSSWSVKKISEVAVVTMGASPSSTSYNDDKIGLPLIQGNADCANRKTKPRIYTSEITKKCKVGDIIMTVRAPVGAISKSNHVACIGRGVCAIDSKINNEFLYQSLVYHENSWGKLSQGSTFEAVSGSDIKGFKISVPPLKEQEKIAEILSTWDSAIEKQEQLIEKKKEFKKGLMQKLLSGEVRFKEFDDKWKKAKLDNYIEPISRECGKPSEGYWRLGLRSHGKGTFHQFVDDPTKVSMDKLYKVKANDLIVNITFAWEHAIAVANSEDEDKLVSHRFPTYEFKENAYSEYFKYYILQSRFREMLVNISPGGAGRNRVMNKKDFLKLEVLIPSYDEQKRIAEVLISSDKEIELLEKELEALKLQKKGLMQRLLTGEVRVKV